jgi:hypothetical protein
MKPRCARASGALSSSARPCSRAVSFAAALVLVAAEARAQTDEEQRWDPGRRVTSPLKDQVRAPEPRPATDGVYGRFNGDLDFGAGLGAELDEGALRGALRVSLHYLSTAGLYVSYRDALGDEAELRRVLSLGVDMRPAFIPRWSKNLDRGPSFLDLAIDSVSLGLGAFWEQPPARAFAAERGFETSLGFGLPLFGHATGPWLESRAQLAFRGMETARAQFVMLLSFHALALSPLARSQ